MQTKNMKPGVERLNYANAGMMALSCAAAFALPFELFLFSYAVLGPLHYLTEISWLHDRHYFTGEGGASRPWLALVGVTMAVLLYGLVAAEVWKSPVSPAWEVALVYAVFGAALLAALVRGRGARALGAALLVVALLLFGGSRHFLLVAFLTVTIVHVLVFTGAFILYGAVKTRSASAYVSLAVFAACAASFFLYEPAWGGHAAGEYVRGSYRAFSGLNAELLRLLDPGAGATAADVYESVAGLKVMRLIAFAYTYHYLNWFSKTSVIGWHEISKRRAALIVGLWLAALALYARDYDAGMAALYLLSILHVLLEFPLNHVTFAGIGREFYGMARRAGAARVGGRAYDS